MPFTESRITATESLRSEAETLVAGKFFAGVKQNNQSAPITITPELLVGENDNEIRPEIQVSGGASGQCFNLEIWLSESPAGNGLTTATYSGTVVAQNGSILTTLTAKKHFIVTTSSGSFTSVLTDTGEATGQYLCVKHPFTGAIIVSNVSTGNWG